MTSRTIELHQKGVITLPVEWRRQHNLSHGDVFTIIDLGEGSFLLSPLVSKVHHFGDKVAEIMEEEEVNLEELLNGLDEERERYYKEHYVNT